MRWLLGLHLALVGACGAAPAPAPVPVPMPVEPAPTAADAAAPPAREVVTYVEIETAWIAEHLPPPADLKAWGADPANAKSIVPATRHILIKGASGADADAARKKAETILARAKKGEDFAKLARENSDDPGSKDKGGLYAGEMVVNFIEPFRVAYAALKPGEMTKGLVRTEFGWHIIRKEKIDDATLLAAYRRASAPAMARRLAEQIAERLKPARAEADATKVFATSVAKLVGATGDDREQHVQILPLDRVTSAPPNRVCMRLIATLPGQVTTIDLGDDEGYLVSKAGPLTDADETTRTTSDLDSLNNIARHCTDMEMPEQLRKMMQGAKEIGD